MKHLVILVEEASMKAFLENVIPKLINNIEIHYQIIDLKGKRNLLKSHKRKILNWNIPESKFIIIIDQDSKNCYDLKNDILQEYEGTDKLSNITVRIVCQELESFYLAQLNAVEKGLGIKDLTKMQQKEKYRNPDLLENPKKELQRITNNQYQQILGSDSISKYLDLTEYRSNSFRVLLEAIKKHVS